MRRLRVRVNMSSARRSGCLVDDVEGAGGGGGANIRVAPASGGSSGGGGGRRQSVSGALADADAESLTCTGTGRTGTGAPNITAVESSGVVGDAPVGAIVGSGGGGGARFSLVPRATASTSTDAYTAPCMNSSSQFTRTPRVN